MRGAAMKVGQLISMDAGEILPPELADIMARLRADADYMPPRQLKTVLTKSWGDGWLKQFQSFDVRPIASASIGQVHRACTRDGRDLAIKVQYPGVAHSIDSDVQNVAALIKLSGLLPKGLDVAPLLEEAKAQLRSEADYVRECRQMERFSTLLAGDDGFVLPTPQHDLTTDQILAMTFVQGDPIESIVSAPQSVRDSVCSRLIGLMFREVFEFRYIQSDPNFANFRYDSKTDRIVLLDFGAVRDVPEDVSRAYAQLFSAALNGRDLHDPALALGFFGHETAERHKTMVLDMMGMVFEPLRSRTLFDFGDASLSRKINEAGMAMAQERDFVHVPPIETLFLQRKFAGLFLLATRMKARVDIAGLIRPHV
jgi:predicted unusual protein kinase regulating ubiquinone biosynthesis (AarF/ABC1/UbiB family)